jgi:hypothetical protein
MVYDYYESTLIERIRGILEQGVFHRKNKGSKKPLGEIS